MESVLIHAMEIIFGNNQMVVKCIIKNREKLLKLKNLLLNDIKVLFCFEALKNILI